MIEDNKVVNLLNDLIEINNDRIEGYDFAAAELKDTDADLQAIFRSMANDSRYYREELTQVVHEIGGHSSTGSTKKGKVYRAWMHVKTTFPGHDRHCILDSCEYGEEEAQQAYNHALNPEIYFDENVRTLLEVQQASLKTARDLIKSFKIAAVPFMV